MSEALGFSGRLARAFLGLMQQPRDVVHDRAFNVGATQENYQIRDVAGLVRDLVPDSTVTLADDAGPDLRNYRVNCDLLAETIPGFEPQWTVARGIEELREAFLASGLSLEDLTGPRLQRIQRVRELLAESRLGSDLRWTGPDAGTRAAG